MIEKKRIQIRRDLEQNWVNINPILLYGEIGFDLTNNKIKIGDGERPWNELSWVNETDLSIYYTKEEIDTILNEININLSNDYYTKEQVDDIISNIEVGGGGSDTNANIVDIMALSYEEQLELINYVIDNNSFPDINTLYTYHGYILNNLQHYSDWWDEELNQKYIIFDLYAHPKSYDIRFITYEWEDGKIYSDINEKFDEQLVTKKEVDTLNPNIVDIMVLSYEEQLELINYVIDNNSFPNINTLYTYHGYILNNLEHYSDWWDESEGTKYIIFDLYAHPKSYDIRFITYAWNEGKIYNDINEKGETEILVTKEQVNELIANSGGGGSVDLSNYYTKEQVYTKEETNTEIQNAIDSIDIPTTDLSDYYTKEQTNTEIQNAINGIDFPTTDLSNYYTKEQVYTKEETNTEIQNAIDSIEIPEQQEVSNATITIIQGDNNQSFNLNQPENQTIMLEDKDFNWFGNEAGFNSLPDEQKVNGIYYISDKINYKEDITGQPYIVYKTSQLLNDKPFATTNDIPKEWFGTQEEFDSLETYETNTTYYIEINGSGGGESGDNVDLSNYYTKDEIGTILNDYYTKEEIDNIVGLINNELEIIING